MHNPFQDHTLALQHAIDKLEEFSRVGSLAAPYTPLQKAISLFRSLMVDKRRHQLPRAKRGEVLKAIEIVNRERLFIQKLQMGTISEQKLADSVTKAIEAYNDSRNRHFSNYAPPTRGLAKFFSKHQQHEFFHKLPSIDILRESSIEFHFPERPVSLPADRTIFAIKPDSVSSQCLTKQSLELFQMKALALLERYGIASNPEARGIVKAAPIHANVDDNALKCTMAQTLALFPGQTVVVRGSSELDPKTHTISKLFPDSFSISLESRQTGFPHPSQRTGWTLANELLPVTPQRPDLLGHLESFFVRKKLATADLHYKGSLIGKAKKLLKLKKQAFEASKQEFILLHEDLAYSILHASQGSTDESFHIVTDYFSDLRNHPAAFERLADTYHSVCDTYITKPYLLFLELCLRDEPGKKKPFEHSYDILEKFFESALAASRSALLSRLHDASPNEKNRFKYIDCMGKQIGRAAKQIILQYFSEDFLFRPPELNLFERKIQAATYRHAEDFLAELNISFGLDDADIKGEISLILRRQLAWDIKLFQSEGNLTIPNRLADYFEERYSLAAREMASSINKEDEASQFSLEYD